jgi:hypothetical protein
MDGGIAGVTAESNLEAVIKDRLLNPPARGKEQVWSSINLNHRRQIVRRFERDQAAEQVGRRKCDCAHRFGSRFEPTPTLVQYEEKGTTFHVP